VLRVLLFTADVPFCRRGEENSDDRIDRAGLERPKRRPGPLAAGQTSCVPQRRSSSMAHNVWFAIAAIALPCLTPATSRAGMVSYQLADYATTLQNGYHVQGEITTDGTLGAITFANILSWSYTILTPGNAVVGTFSSTDPGASVSVQGTVIATAGAIVMPGEPSEFNEVFLLDPDPTTFYAFGTLPTSEVSQALIGGTPLWNSEPAGVSDLVYATAVPEPASLTLFGLGVAGLGLRAFWANRRMLRAGR
jgi:PEP-CTERM motif